MIDRHINWIPYTAIACGSILFFIAIFFTVKAVTRHAQIKERTEAARITRTVVASAINPLELSAQGIIIYDATTNISLYQKRQNDVFPVASVTKLATAITALELIDGVTPVVVQNPLTMPLDPTTVLPAGKTFSLNDMVAFMLATSSNDGAKQIADFTAATIRRKTDQKAYFQVLATKTMEDHGITPWLIGTPSGLDTAYDPTVYASPLSVMHAMLYFVSHYPAIAEMIAPQKMLAITDTVGNTYEFRHTLAFDGTVPKEIVFAKTGFTNDAQGSLAFIIKHPQSNHMIAVVLLNMPKENRLPEARKIVNAFNSISL